MKIVRLLIITTFFVAVGSIASAQSAKFNSDSTVTYLKSNFKIGQEVQLFYGSGADKDFKFIELVNFNNFMHQPKMLASYSKQKFIIDYVYLKDGKCTIRGKAPFTDSEDNFIVVDVEGAIDNKEIIAPDNKVTVTLPPAKKVIAKKRQ